ncbi:hypothetical protein A9Q81_23080 [Gammaproteobacteria bacterium 42_54_T18]|nr:hypothetical protein A9Q81_23080 [Gammaproteobacteria bacterium 42_54_T18]
MVAKDESMHHLPDTDSNKWATQMNGDYPLGDANIGNDDRIWTVITDGARWAKNQCMWKFVDG